MRNLEAKFRLADLARARMRAEAIGFAFAATLIQRDTFFAVPQGKLKLREEDDGAALIHYQREDERGFDLSNYTIVRVADAAAIRTMLESALAVIAEVRKRRILMLRENIRFHLDEVEGLGEFGEIEMAMGAEDEPDAARATLNAILDALEVRSADLVRASYFELMAPTRPLRSV